MQKTYTARKTTRQPLKAMAPAEQLKVQIARAKEQGVKVVMVGKVLADGSPCWIVPSQSKALEGLHHIVTRAKNGALVCDCWACQKDGLVCIHRAATYLFLQAEAAKAQPAPAAQPPAQPRGNARNPGIADDTAEFSIFKTERSQGYQSVAARANADRAGDAEGYVPADYRSHEYR